MIISDVKNLDKKSSDLIEVKCDNCFKIFNIKYINYHRNGNKDGFYTCKTCKTKKTNLEKWGVENPSQVKEFKEKKRKSFMEKWGVDHPSKLDLIKEKKKKTFLDKWGVENPFQSDDIKNKIKKTNTEKWGVENPSKSDYIKEKKRKSFIEKCGVDHPLKFDEIKEKIKKNNLEKWGVECVLKNENIKQRIKQTMINLYGFENPMKSDLIKNKIKETNLEKWGVEFYYQTDEFKEKSKETNLKKYNSTSYKKSIFFYNKSIIGSDDNHIEYLGNSEHLFKCNCGENFIIGTDNYFTRKKSNINICTKCNPIGDSRSIKEGELFQYIKSIYDGEIMRSYRDDMEIDIYLPELKIGFEFNGLYWHSELYRDRWYHLNKTNYFQERGIRIIHIWEDDWVNKRSILESQIKNLLNKSENKIFARKCQIREIGYKLSSKFLEDNHIQGKDYSKVKLGLYYNGELLSVMTFSKSEGRKKMPEEEWNLSRFCNKLNYNVVGGASKLLNYFIKKYDVKRLVSYADRDWSNGDLYSKMGFNLLYKTNPDYKYIINDRRLHKSRYRKSNTGISESKLELLKIWDCGKLKFEKINSR